MSLTQSLREGGQGGTVIPGSMDLMGPVGFRRTSRGPIEMILRNQCVVDGRSFFFFFLRSHQLSEKTEEFFLEDLFPFFFEITSKFGQNCSIFSVCFGVHKTGDP